VRIIAVAILALVPCGVEQAVPRPSDAVALDAHVWLKHSSSDTDPVLVALDPLTDIPITVREWCKTLELAPKSPLPAARRFEVWLVPHDKKQKRVLATSFVTGLLAASSAPPKPTLVAHHEHGACDAIVLEGKKEAPLYGIWTPGAFDKAPIAITTSLRIDDACTDLTTLSNIAVRPMDLAGHLGEPIEIAVR
jgi:hypothetical protein